ncbi:MAG TPA: DUF5654 family protein [Patescibacteria group bacterium]|nr:DUF5654 family protein [Patescibacteria group bacterium]
MPTIPTERLKENARELQIALLKQLVTLATSGFGLVAALAWNSVIQELVNTYIKKWLPAGWGIVSLLIYALIVTILAVLVTYNLTRTLKRLSIEDEEDKETTKSRKKKE